MTLIQQLITIGLAAAGTMATRATPFVLFSESRPVPKIVEYLGGKLPLAIFAFLVVYCLKDVSLLTGSHGAPEAIAVLATFAVHTWRRSMLLSIACGTICYMLLVQVVF